MTTPCVASFFHFPTLLPPPTQAIQKFVHVVLQRMFCNNSDSQDYFGRREAVVEAPDGSKATKLWMDIVLSQLEAPLGPAVTLAALLSANEDLMARYATPDLVMRFAGMVRGIRRAGFRHA